MSRFPHRDAPYWVHSNPNTPAASADTTDLAACANELTAGPDRLLDRLRELLPDGTDTAPGYSDTGPNHAKVTGSPAPWNDHIAGAFFEVHAGARRHESALTLLLFRRARYRGGSDRQTCEALQALPPLIEAATQQYPDHRVPREAARDLTAWPRAIRIALDEARYGEEPWTKAPGNLRCPYCDRRLVLAPGWDREHEPPVWCRACPHRLEDEVGQRRVDRQWPAGAWLAVLQQRAG